MESQLINYLNINLEEQKLKHQFYFDSADVIDIIEGVNIFYSNGFEKIFNKADFDQDKRIIQALAYAELFKEECPIRLLPTHQAELISKIKSTENTNIQRSKNFLYKLWYEDLSLLKNNLDNSQEFKLSFDNDFVKVWVENGKGESLFKTIYLSDRLPLVHRLNQFIKTNNGACKYTKYTIDDIEILDSEWSLFQILIGCLNTISTRLTRTENNYRDALALLYLSRKVKMYNNNQTDIIPILFDSQNFARHIHPEVLNEYFSIELSNNRSIKYCVLMPSMYFKIYALLRINPSFPDEDAKYREFLESQKVMTKSIQLLDRSNIQQSSNNSLTINKLEIEDRIKKYLDYDFFRTILLDTWTKDIELTELISNNLSKDSIINSDQLAKVRDEVIKVLDNISDELSDFIYWTSKTYNILDKNVSIFAEIFNKLKSSNINLDVFNHFSLFRFNIPSNHKMEIHKLFSENGLVSKITNTRDSAFIILWNLHFEVAKNRQYHNDENKLFILFSSFWILDMYEFISQIKVDINHLHHSLLMLKGACIYRALIEGNIDERTRRSLHQTYKKIIDILSKRRAEYHRDDTSNYGEINLALSYLWFHYWILDGGRLYLENYKDYKFIQKDNNETAIRYAREAFEYFERFSYNSISHKVYALNILIYFVIDSGSDENFLSIEDFRSQFLSLRSSSNEWHFRFDDTIARNFHRISLMVSSNERKLHYSNLAINHLNRSINKLADLENKDIDELRNYKLILENYSAEIEMQSLK